MSAAEAELLTINPLELKFPFELKKQTSCSLELSNKTENHVAFKAYKEVPADMQCKDKFLLQSVVASPGTNPKDITQEMFNKEAGCIVEESKLRVIYLPPQQPSSPVVEGSEEGSSPKQSLTENDHQSGFEELVRRNVNKSRSGGVSFMFAIIVGLLAMALGYYLKST